MNEHVIIVGGGLAGLSAGCHARANGFRTTIVEHNMALGGVCTAWRRGDYTIDGCIHWLTGGAFTKLYEELGILPKVGLHTIDEFARYSDVERGIDVPVTRDLDALAHALAAIAPADELEIRRLFQGANDVAELDPKVDAPPELQHLSDGLSRVWEARHQIGTMVHYRKPLGEWARTHLSSEPMRRFFLSLAPAEAPTLFLLMMLGYLERGWLSRPNGGTARFRDALVDTYHALGGEERMQATVEEVLVEHGHARGVRLADGTMLEGDVVISTSSTPETTLRLLGGRYAEGETRRRLEDWKLFDPIVVVSFGVADRLDEAPSTWILDGVAPFEIGGRTNERLLVRIFNDDPTLAPPGHTVVQSILSTDYEWWATRGSAYAAAKEATAEAILAKLSVHLPPMRHAVRMIDVATPLTYWNMARSWRGAYEGWMPRGRAFAHPHKKLPGLEGFYMAGQWVEPGGGVPTAIMSGRQVVQLLCADFDREYAPPRLAETTRDLGRARPSAARVTGPA